MIPLKTFLPMNLYGDWTIKIGDGNVTINGKTVTVNSTLIDIPPVKKVQVRNEKYDSLPIFNPKACGYAKGKNLNNVRTEECSATGVLVPGSIKIKLLKKLTKNLEQGVDFEIDEYWGTFGRLEGGLIGEEQAVLVDYDFVPCRLDSIVVDTTGKVKLIKGDLVVGATCPPKTKKTELVIANVYLNGVIDHLTDENLYPIQADLQPIVHTGASPAETLLPKTLAKLRAGESINYVAWGDSVTEGVYFKNPERDRYHDRFARELRQRFPKATINHFTAGWGGRDSKTYMESPRGSQYDFVRDCIERKPDLVTVEFVNDAWLDDAGVKERYSLIMAEFNKIGAEVILIVPHFVRPDWMNLTSMKSDEDPRPYVRALRNFAAENHVALADASKYWARLWRQGIPYMTLENNSINHPDARGHQIFVDALMELFPQK
jgi:lysophospholipase L1-like esterase